MADKNKISVDERIGLYERFLDEFTKDGYKLEPCNPDAVFNWFINNIERILIRQNTEK